MDWVPTVAIGFLLALLFGTLAKRFGQSPVIGYLLAGGDAFLERSTEPSTLDQIGGVVLILLVLEAARRSSGWKITTTAMAKNAETVPSSTCSTFKSKALVSNASDSITTTKPMRMENPRVPRTKVKA